MLQVLGRNNSINVRKVLWACAVLQLPFENENWGVPPKLLTDQTFLALNPNGLVPVLKDGDFVLWESNSIIRYLANRYEPQLASKQPRESWLYPTDPHSRAHVDRWLDWQATDLNQSWVYSFMSLVRQSPAHMNAETLCISNDKWIKQMRIMDAQLSQTDAYIAGVHFSLADIPVALSVNRWFSTPFERPDMPAVAAYFERLRVQPGFLDYCANGMP